jgi:hypothetical protein
MAEANDPYHCPDCNSVAVKQLTLPQVITEGEQIPYMHPAFGTVMTDKQAKAEAKRRGWVEVGNEDVSKHTSPPPRKSYEDNDYFL